MEDTETSSDAQTFVDRMVDELNELEDKIAKINAFIHSHTFSELQKIEQHMLYSQGTAMAAYLCALNMRLEYYVTERTPV